MFTQLQEERWTHLCWKVIFVHSVRNSEKKPSRLSDMLLGVSPGFGFLPFFERDCVMVCVIHILRYWVEFGEGERNYFFAILKQNGMLSKKVAWFRTTNWRFYKIYMKHEMKRVKLWYCQNKTRVFTEPPKEFVIYTRPTHPNCHLYGSKDTFIMPWIIIWQRGFHLSFNYFLFGLLTF
jgi:hypothetical protein